MHFLTKNIEVVWNIQGILETENLLKKYFQWICKIGQSYESLYFAFCNVLCKYFLYCDIITARMNELVNCICILYTKTKSFFGVVSYLCSFSSFLSSFHSSQWSEKCENDIKCLTFLANLSVNVPTLACIK